MLAKLTGITWNHTRGLLLLVATTERFSELHPDVVIQQAWLDLALNRACGNFFLDTLPTLDEAYLRPRYPGYIPFQDHAGLVVQRYLRQGGDPHTALAEIDTLYRQSQTARQGDRETR
jgi:hypothetical protein